MIAMTAKEKIFDGNVRVTDCLYDRADNRAARRRKDDHCKVVQCMIKMEQFVGTPGL